MVGSFELLGWSGDLRWKPSCLKMDGRTKEPGFTKILPFTRDLLDEKFTGQRLRPIVAQLVRHVGASFPDGTRFRMVIMAVSRMLAFVVPSTKY